MAVQRLYQLSYALCVDAGRQYDAAFSMPDRYARHTYLRFVTQQFVWMLDTYILDNMGSMMTK